MLAFSIDYYGIFFGATQSVELFCTYIGFVVYRILMNIDMPLGNTLPDMVITIVICLIVGKFVS